MDKNVVINADSDVMESFHYDLSVRDEWVAEGYGEVTEEDENDIGKRSLGSYT